MADASKELELLFFLVLLSLAAPVTSTRRKCPCNQPELCELITRNNTREIFMFTTQHTNSSEYKSFDWKKITTLALANYTDDGIMCYGHKKGVRIVLMVGYPGKMLLNDTARANWISQVSHRVIYNFMDGVHLDFEDLISVDENAKRAALLDMFTKLSVLLKAYTPKMQVTIDFDSLPHVPRHAYGYKNLMTVADFAFLRTYDQRRWVFPPTPCFAWAIDANNVTILGLMQFRSLGIPASKLVLGFAWFGFDYECLNNPTAEGRCFIKTLSQGRCSDAETKTYEYATIVENLLPQAVGGLHRDVESGAPYINYKDAKSESWRQVWYNDPQSLKPRYALADRYGTRGVGAWILKDLDYSHTAQAAKIRREMFDALPNWNDSM